MINVLAALRGVLVIIGILMPESGALFRLVWLSGATRSPYRSAARVTKVAVFLKALLAIGAEPR